MEKLTWWGYLHENGTVQAKRVLNDLHLYTSEANQSPFVIRTFGPFEAENRDEALEILEQRLIGDKKTI